MQKWKFAVLVGYVINILTLPTIVYVASAESLESQYSELNVVYSDVNDTVSSKNNTYTPKQEEKIEPTTNSLHAYSDITKIRVYLGLNFVYGIANFHDKLGDDISDFVESNTPIDTSDFFNTNNLRGNLNFGAQINKYFAIEGFFQHTYSKQKEFEFKWYSSGYYYDVNHTHMKMRFNALSIGIDALGFLPITNTSISLVGLFGIGYYETRWKSIADNWASNNFGYTSEHDIYHGSGKENYLGFRFGLGGQYNLSESWDIRLMLKYVEINSDKSEDLLDNFVDISLGLQYTF